MSGRDGMPRDPLNPRWMQVLRLKCEEGLSGKEVAARLGIEHRTVKNHTTDGIRRMQAADGFQACWRFRDLCMRARPLRAEDV